MLYLITFNLENIVFPRVIYSYENTDTHIAKQMLAVCAYYVQGKKLKGHCLDFSG